MDDFKRRRKKNFSDEEIRCLIEGVNMTKSLLLSKIQTNDTTRQKREIWKRIAANVNACTDDGLFRTIDEIKKKWKDLKAETMALKLGEGKRSGQAGKKPPFFDFIASILDGDMNGIPNNISIEGLDGFQITLREKVPETADPVSSVTPIIAMVDPSSVPSVKQEDEISLALNATNVTFANDSITTQVPNNCSSAPNSYFTVEPSPVPHIQRQEPPPTKRERPPNAHQDRKRSKLSLYAETEDTNLFNEWIRSCISKNRKEEELIELKCKKLRKELGIS